MEIGFKAPRTTKAGAAFVKACCKRARNERDPSAARPRNEE